MVWKLCLERSLLRSASVTDQDNPHPADIWVGDDPHQEWNAATDDDHILAHLMESTGDAEKTPVREKESTETEIVIVSTRIASAETGTDLDQEKRSTEREDKADQTHQESE